MQYFRELVWCDGGGGGETGIVGIFMGGGGHRRGDKNDNEIWERGGGGREGERMGKEERG